VAPQDGARLVAAVARDLDAEYFYDWGGGLIWLAPAASSGDAGAAAIRAALGASGGHATLIRAPAELRAAVPVFQPQEPAKAALTTRVKDSFDPKRVLNPGRMYAGV
jgi:glycolate oxidase FAD binding subunit